MSTQYESLALRAYNHLCERMHEGALRPGDLIDRRKLAAELGSSVAPVSEAIKRLEYEGVFESMPRRGTRVLVPGPQDVVGQMMVREALECQAARIYCGKRIRNARDRIMTLARESDQYSDNHFLRLKADLEIHVALVELTGFRTLIQQHRNVASMWRFYNMALATNFPTTPNDFHVDMCEDLCDISDPDEAAARVRHHIRTGKPQLFEDA